MIYSIKLFNNKVMDPVPKHLTFWDWSHVMRDRSRLCGSCLGLHAHVLKHASYLLIVEWGPFKIFEVAAL